MSVGVKLYGETTRELYDAWHARVGATPTIPQAEIQPLFNDIALYPCTSQVPRPRPPGRPWPTPRPWPPGSSPWPGRPVIMFTPSTSKL